MEHLFVRYLRQHSWRVAARVRDEESKSLFEDDMMEDIRLTCQEYPQQRMGGTRIGAGARKTRPDRWHVGSDGGTRIGAGPARTGTRIEAGGAILADQRLQRRTGSGETG